MSYITVAVINASTVVSDDECRMLTAALQKQVSNDFAPVWGIGADLVFVGKGETPAAGTWWLSILDNTDHAGVCGHHDLTPDGLPVAKAFAGTDKKYGLKWTVTASHELLEMLADPNVNLTVFPHHDPAASKIYVFELCDPCEDDSCAYQIDGIDVCDFVYPAYFEAFRQPGSAKFDHQDLLKAPVPAVLKGGYINSLDITSADRTWHSINAAKIPDGRPDRSRLPEPVSARKIKRQTPATEWKRSTAYR